MTNDVLAIIPARGGSKGIPRKNLRPLAGKPLIAHAVHAALASKYVTRVVVSTEDAEIAAVAKGLGADVVERPMDIASDHATSESALLHALHYLEASEGYRPELVVFLQCTSPLTTAEHIDETIDALRASNADSAFTATRFFHFVWRAAEEGADGVNHDRTRRPRRQDREPEYLENGAVYVMKASGFRDARHRFFGKTVIHEVGADCSIEIDEPLDMTIAEAVMRARADREAHTRLPTPVGALVLDFDGVFTDNRVLVSDEGHESVLCDRSDGWGLTRLKRAGTPILVISTEKNAVVAARCAKLGLECYHGVDDKVAVLSEWLAHRAIAPSSVVFVGNDENDIPCLRYVGCPVVVADAHPAAARHARIILERPGGHGAIREMTDLIMESIEEQKNDAKR